MQKIAVKQIPVQLHIGCYDEERARLQTLYFDVELEFSMELSSRSDDLRDTIDYTGIIQSLQAMVKDREWKLVEKLSRDVGEMLLEKFPLLSAVTVSITKHIPFPCEGIVCSYRSEK